MPRTVWNGAISFGLVTSLNYAGTNPMRFARDARRGELGGTA